MALIRKILAIFRGKKRAYNIELPIGLEVSDGDRAAIYGWPDRYVNEGNTQIK